MVLDGIVSETARPFCRTSQGGKVWGNALLGVSWRNMEEFGRYQLVKRIGAGGMAEVFLARHFGAEGLEKVVVIKKIRPEHAEKPRFITMFIDEAKIAVSLNHPNIAQVYEFGRVDRDFFLAMEYVEGQDLGQALSKHKKIQEQLPTAEVVYIGIEIAKALDYAHRKCDKFGHPLGIVHRDVSPQNILLSTDGSVKLLDFGIAKAAGTQENDGEIRGKYSYMSPEQARGEDIDHRSDLFSLGAVLWEMLAGSPLFPYTDANDTLARIQKTQVPQEIPGRRDVGPDLLDILLKALSKSPEDRYQDAREFQIALTRSLFQTGTIADSVTLAAHLQQVQHNQPPAPAPLPESQTAPSTSHLKYQGTDPLLDQLTGNGTLGTQITESPTYTPASSTASVPLTSHSTHSAHRDTMEMEEEILDSERKECVLVSGDLRGFNELRANIDIDRWRQILMDYIRIVESIAFKNQAIVDRVNENGFTILLGLPVSSENVAERALELTQDLTEAVDAININLESALQLSTGVVVGTVLLEYTYPNKRKTTPPKFEWFFDDQAPGRGGLHLAEALARAGMAREILMGGRIFRRVRFSYKADPVEEIAVPLDNHILQLSAHRLVGPKHSHEQVHEVRRAYHRMFGRELALKSLREGYRKVRIGNHTGGVLITGETGVGKSTLVNEFVAGLTSSEAEAAQISIFRGVAELHDKDTAYGSLTTLLFEMLGLRRNADLRLARTRIERIQKNLLQHLPEQVQRQTTQGLAFLIGVRLDNERIVERLDPQNRRAFLFRSLRNFLHAMASRKPVLFAIEDVHNVDSSSLSFLADYLNNRQEVPIFFVLTSLPIHAETSDSQLQNLLSSAQLRPEPLGELPPHAARALATALLPDDLSTDNKVVTAILDRAGGNPLYIKEIIELISERHLTSPRELLLQLEASDAEPLWIPTTVEGLLTSRIDRLPQGAKKTLQRCGLFGRTFDEEMVHSVLGALGNEVDRSITAAQEFERLQHLVEQGFLVRLDRKSTTQDNDNTRALRRRFQDHVQQRSDETQAPTHVWAFANSAAAEVASRGIVEPERAELHFLIADYLLQRSDDLYKIDVVTIAHHLDAAEEETRAGEMFLVGAEQAINSVGGDECLRLVNKALERVDYGSEHYRSALDLKERALALLGLPTQRRETLEELLDLLEEDGTTRQILQVKGRILRLLYEEGSLDKVEPQAQTLLQEAQEQQDQHARGRALRLLHMVYRDTGRHALALKTIEETVDCFRDTGDTEGLWAALVSRGITLRQTGQLQGALSTYQEALNLVENKSFLRQEQTTRLNLAILYANLGEYDLALRNYTEALNSIRSLGYIREEAAVMANLGHLHLRLGNYNQAQRMLLASVRLARKTRDKLALADALVALGMVHHARERHREAESFLTKGLNITRSISNLYLTIHAIAGLAEIKLALRAPEKTREALELGNEATELGNQANLPWARALGSSLSAEAHMMLGDLETACALSCKAVSLLEGSDVDGAEYILARHARIARDLDPKSAARARFMARSIIEKQASRLGNIATRKRFMSSQGVRSILSL